MEHILQSWTLRIFIVLLFSCFLPEWHCIDQHKATKTVTHPSSAGQHKDSVIDAHTDTTGQLKESTTDTHTDTTGQHQDSAIHTNTDTNGQNRESAVDTHTGQKEVNEHVKTSDAVTKGDSKSKGQEEHGSELGSPDTQHLDKQVREEIPQNVAVKTDIVSENVNSSIQTIEEESNQNVDIIKDTHTEGDKAKDVEEKPTSAISTPEIKIDRPCFPDDQAIEEEKARLKSRSSTSKKDDGENDKKVESQAEKKESTSEGEDKKEENTQGELKPDEVKDTKATDNKDAVEKDKPDDEKDEKTTVSKDALEKEETPDAKLPKTDDIKDVVEKDKPADVTDEKSTESKDVAEKDKTADEKDTKPTDSKDAVEKKEEVKEEDKTTEDEDIPSFDEWKKKKMAEQEMGRKGNGGQGSASGQHRQFNLNQNSKNHASADCGAKILASNSEAQSPSAILMQNRDVYMLNPCSAKIWFTVELCEPIQIKQIEIANFELFSSTPASFRIHVSDRYPSRDWHVLGTFSAKDQRTLQSFSINDQLMFTKYLKVEMLTFFGSEHYCPLSLLRVFGTSMEEEIIQDSESSSDTEENLDGDLLTDDDLIAGGGLKKTNILAGAIADAVNNIVKHAAKVFTGSDDTAKPKACVDSNDDLLELRPCLPEEDPNITTQKQPEDKGCVAMEVETMDTKPTTPRNLTWSEKLQDMCNPCTYCQKCDYSEYFPVCKYLKYMKALYPITCKDFIVKTPVPQTNKPKEKEKKAEKKERKEDEKIRDVESDKTKDDFVKDKSDSVVETSADGGNKIVTDSKVSESVSESGSTKDKQSTDTSSKQQQNIKTTLQSGKDGTQGVAMETSESQKEIIVTVQPKVEKEIKKPVKSDTSEKIGVKTDNSDVVQTKVNQLEPSKPIITKSDIQMKSGETASLDRVVITTPEVQKTAPSLNAVKTDTAGKDGEAEQIAPTPSLTVEKTDATSKQSGGETVKLTNGNTASKAEPVAKTTDLHTEKEVKETNGVQTEQSAGSTGTTGTSGSPVPVQTEQSIGSGGSVPGGKESIFMRLNNRIKNLEYNMSLSQQYLQELSQKYRKQMDEMQKNFNKTINKLTETSKESESKDLKQQEAISSLEEQVVRLTNILQNVSEEMTVKQSQMIERHFFLMLIEVLIISFLFLFCTSRHTGHTRHVLTQPTEITTTSTPPKPKTKKKIKRRNSADGTINHKKLEMDNIIKRHQDDENIQIKGDYSSLLIIEPTKPLKSVLHGLAVKDDIKVHVKKYKPKLKSKSRLRSSSSSNLDNVNSHDATVEDNQSKTNISSAGLIFSGNALHNSTVEGSHRHKNLCNGESVPKCPSVENCDRIETLYESVGVTETGRMKYSASFPPSNKHRKGTHSRRDKAGHSSF